MMLEVGDMVLVPFSGMGSTGLIFVMDEGKLIAARTLSDSDFPLLVISETGLRWKTVRDLARRGTKVLLGSGEVGVLTEDFSPPHWTCLKYGQS